MGVRSSGKSTRETRHKVIPHLKTSSEDTGGRTGSQADWEKAAGVICSNCKQEAFRSRDGLCMGCSEKANEFEIRDKAGVLQFVPVSVIMAIVHSAKKEG